MGLGEKVCLRGPGDAPGKTRSLNPCEDDTRTDFLFVIRPGA